MISVLPIIAAAFIASEGGEELRLYQTTASKDFREIATSGFTIHPYPAAPALWMWKALETELALSSFAIPTVSTCWSSRPTVRSSVKSNAVGLSSSIKASISLCRCPEANGRFLRWFSGRRGCLLRNEVV